MHIVVCIKQVPDTANLKFDSQGNVSPESVELILNPCCGYALEAAVRLKEAGENITVTALTLGPAQAKDVLKRAIAMGADQAFHLSDSAFDQADALTLSRILGKAIQKLVPDYNLLLFGQFAEDSMNGATGPMVAQLLGAPCITLANKAEMMDGQTLRVFRETEEAVEEFHLQLPGMVCFANSEHEPRIPSIKGVMKANRTEIPVLDWAALGLSEGEVCPAGAGVVQLNTWRKPRKTGGVKIQGDDAAVAVGQLLGFLREQKVL